MYPKIPSFVRRKRVASYTLQGHVFLLVLIDVLLCRPHVDFDVRLLRAVQVMDIPMLKDFINALVMDSLTYGKLI